MITVKQTVEWLKALVPDAKFYNSAIDKNESESIGVYARRNGAIQPQAVGSDSGYQIKSITLLVHWSANADTCEQKALEVWNALRSVGTAETIGGKRCWIEARQAPVSIGKDAKGIFESVVDFDIYIRNGD